MSVCTEDPEVVIETLGTDVASPIIVDGRNGAGKSQLAGHVADALHGTHVDLDDYLIGKGGYVRNLDFERLASDLKSQPPPIVLSGVCALQVLVQCGVEPGPIVYVEHLKRDGRRSTMRENICNVEISLEAALSEIGRGETAPGMRDFQREQARYHREFDPRSKAAVVFTRRSIYA